MNEAKAGEIRHNRTSSWAEVSLSALRQNFRTIQQHVGEGVAICAVVKADAYGNGALECSRALAAEGTRWFAVNSLEEAAPLRQAGIAGRILLMTGFWRGEEEEIIRLRLTPTVWESWQIESVSHTATKLGVNGFAVHLKVDSGMGRLGAGLETLPAICESLRAAPHLHLEGLSTHMASSEVLDWHSAKQQLEHFEEARQVMRSAGFEPELLHVSNTCAAIARREAWYNMVRPGLGLYGYHLPFQRSGKVVGEKKLELKPILTWKTRVLTVREVAAGRPLGYGGTHVTCRPSRIAVLPVGYADGLNRQLSSRGRVIVRGHHAPVVGRISMNLTLVDVTDIPAVTNEDEVVLLGSDAGLSVDAQEHAELSNTISYEILCSISKRVPRQYCS